MTTLCHVSHISGPKFTVLGKTLWEAAQGAEVALVSRGTIVPLSPLQQLGTSKPVCTPGSTNRHTYEAFVANRTQRA